jgi:hypothetical protein
MSLLGLLSQLGHALVSLGLGGPGASEAQAAIPCPEVLVSAGAHTRIEAPAQGHTVVNLTAGCSNGDPP